MTFNLDGDEAMITEDFDVLRAVDVTFNEVMSWAYIINDFSFHWASLLSYSFIYCWVYSWYNILNPLPILGDLQQFAAGEIERRNIINSLKPLLISFERL